MKTIERLEIKNGLWLEIVAYYLKTEDNSTKLKDTDRGAVILHKEKQAITLYENSLEDIFLRLRIFLCKILNHDELVSDKRFIGNVSKCYLRDRYHRWKDEEDKSLEDFYYRDYLVFESEHLATWLYADKQNIYLEVGYTLFAHFDFKEEPNDILFEEHNTSYAPLECVLLSYGQAKEWLKKCNEIIKILLKVTHCCLEMESAVENSIESPLVYNARMRDYTITAPKALMKRNEIWTGYGIKFCPFCSATLPKDLTSIWFEILEKEYGIDDPYDDEQKKCIPQEFMTDEWWKKRGL